MSDASVDANDIPRQVTRNVKMRITASPRQNWTLSPERESARTIAGPWFFESIQLVATRAVASSRRIPHQSAVGPEDCSSSSLTKLASRGAER